VALAKSFAQPVTQAFPEAFPVARTRARACAFHYLTGSDVAAVFHTGNPDGVAGGDVLDGDL